MSAPERDPAWYVAAYRSTTALLVLGALAAGWVIWSQQRELEQLRTTNTVASRVEESPRAPTPTVLPSNATEVADDLPWRIVDGAGTYDCGAAQQLRWKEEVAIPSFQHAVGSYAFGIVRERSNEETVVLSRTPCPSGSEGMPWESTKGFESYVTVRRGEGVFRPLSYAEFLRCPADLRGTHVSSELSFCYPEAWGETITEPTTISTAYRTGMAYEFAWKRASNLFMTVTSGDFSLTGPRDAPGPVYHADLSKSDDELRAEYAKRGEVLAFRRVLVGGKPGIAVRYVVPSLDQDTAEPITSEYLIPDAFPWDDATTFDLLFSAQGTEATDMLDRIVETITFE